MDSQSSPARPRRDKNSSTASTVFCGCTISTSPATYLQEEDGSRICQQAKTMNFVPHARTTGIQGDETNILKVHLGRKTCVTYKPSRKGMQLAGLGLRLCKKGNALLMWYYHFPWPCTYHSEGPHPPCQAHKRESELCIWVEDWKSQGSKNKLGT